LSGGIPTDVFPEFPISAYRVLTGLGALAAKRPWKHRNDLILMANVNRRKLGEGIIGKLAQDLIHAARGLGAACRSHLRAGTPDMVVLGGTGCKPTEPAAISEHTAPPLTILIALVRLKPGASCRYSWHAQLRNPSHQEYCIPLGPQYDLCEQLYL
jgi:hypothetical protein